MDASRTEALSSSSHKRLSFKRGFDILFSSTALICGLPLFLLLALLVAITSRANPIYRQMRVGRGGKLFACFKFRTMCLDAEERLQKLLQTHPERRREWLATRKLKDDPRITSLGHFLRRTSLDELPQFLNVLLGDMSMVGPRPISEEEVRLYLGHHASEILQMKPGITGIWQTSGRNNVSFAQRIHMDREYVRTHTFLSDLKLVLKTIPQLMLGKGAY